MENTRKPELPILLNPQAGRGASEEEAALLTAFGEAGALPRVRVVEGRELRGAVHDLVRAGAKAVGVAGGDGTLSTAANALVDTGTAMLPIPLGTFNHFAQRYGISTVEAAVQAWQRNSAALVPVGLLNNRVFVNNASCGFYPHVVRHRERLERFLPHRPAMYLASMGVLMKLPRMKLDLEVGGSQRTIRTSALWVGIGRHSLRVPQPGDPHTEGSVLEVIAPKPSTRLGIVALTFRLMFKVMRGIEAPRDRALEVMHVRSFVLRSRVPIDVGMDGEPLLLTPPLHFRFVNDGLRVLCLVAPDR